MWDWGGGWSWDWEDGGEVGRVPYKFRSDSRDGIYNAADIISYWKSKRKHVDVIRRLPGTPLEPLNIPKREQRVIKNPVINPTREWRESVLKIQHPDIR